jgi:predicted ribosome quality control (RQC) complex YloA/Tae2 family protein
MPLDGVVLHHLTQELQPLIGCQIQKIRQTPQDEFYLTCYQHGQNIDLLLSAHPEFARLHRTNHSILSQETSHFLTICRHHIDQGFITGIHQHGNDRVIIIEIERRNVYGDIDSYQLIAELMGRHSNLFVVKDGTVIDSYRRIPPFSNAKRTVLPNSIYSYPPSTKPNPFDSFRARTFEDAMAYEGISSLLANAVEDGKLQSLTNVQPSYSPSANQWHSLDLFHDSIHFNSISELLDYVYVDVLHQQRFSQITKDLRLAVTAKKTKAENKKANLEADLVETEHRDQFRIYGDLLYANPSVDTKGVSFIDVLDFEGQPITIPVDPTKSTKQMAAQYYKKYQKAKKAIDHLHEQLADVDQDLDYYDQILFDLEIATPEDLDDIRSIFKPTSQPKKQSPKPSITTFRHEGVDFLVGTNAKKNDLITHQLASKEDLWFHVKDQPGAHVVAKTAKETESTIRYGANLAALYSRAKYSSSVEVQYTNVKHLKKIPGRPGSFVSVSKYKTIFIDPDSSLL